ncbi:MAG TPA: asparagine synthase (glutamine-hydrolyzing) [Vicinamibacterales bacterium]|jgi:asparagine synthase (glutamine-hydrolysing)|nr:asparagine synthase (glutamine-hydrolyzing) [Vicinamibacterales bacterium]
MCGIAGIVARDPGVRVNEDRLARMRDALRHRGPDGSGLRVDGPVGLAHTRLAIVDVARGEQPMSNEAGDVWIAFNGEIYNHADLRPRLEASGHRYRTRCDTETIVHLYEERGDQVVDALQGMFAFAIWDGPRQRLLLARDRLGIKPLYYSVEDGELRFASEIKALLAAGAGRGRFNEAVLPEFLATRFVSGDETFFRGVRKLMPGHVLTWSPGDPGTPRRYWQLPDPVPAREAVWSAGDLRERLEAAVASHLMSDVPLGVFLSGGIDSSALAALAARATPSPLQTFAVGFAEAEANELPYARLVAEHIGATHREVTLTPRAFFETLPHAVWHEDEPMAFSSSVPLFALARLAREHVKVVLTGEGADELFLGYNRYRVTQWNARLGQPYWSAMPGPARRVLRDAVRALPAPLARVATRTFVGLDPGIRGLYHENFAVCPLALQQRLLRCDLLAASDPYATQAAYFDGASGSLLDRLTRAELQSYLLELLMKQDQMSMASSIESRVPFLDDRLVAHVASMPGDRKLPGWKTKVLLRAAVRDLLPAPILTRRKLGFPVPFGDWLRGPFGSVVDEFVLGPRTLARAYFDRTALTQLVAEHRTGRASRADALWLLVNLEIWQRIFMDGEAPGDVMHGLAARRTTATHAADLTQCAFSG